MAQARALVTTGSEARITARRAPRLAPAPAVPHGRSFACCPETDQIAVIDASGGLCEVFGEAGRGARSVRSAVARDRRVAALRRRGCPRRRDRARGGRRSRQQSRTDLRARRTAGRHHRRAGRIDRDRHGVARRARRLAVLPRRRRSAAGRAGASRVGRSAARRGRRRWQPHADRSRRRAAPVVRRLAVDRVASDAGRRASPLPPQGPERHAGCAARGHRDGSRHRQSRRRRCGRGRAVVELELAGGARSAGAGSPRRRPRSRGDGGGVRGSGGSRGWAPVRAAIRQSLGAFALPVLTDGDGGGPVPRRLFGEAC